MVAFASQSSSEKRESSNCGRSIEKLVASFHLVVATWPAYLCFFSIGQPSCKWTLLSCSQYQSKLAKDYLIKLGEGDCDCASQAGFRQLW